MAKNYIYRMDHDTGFAPHIERELCFLCGCKISSVEKGSNKGSWVIGIGGNNTGQPDKVIYIMEVDENLSYLKFRKKYPEIKYLKPRYAGPNVLISKHFWYFGDKAIPVPLKLEHIIINHQGSKLVNNEDIDILKKHLESNPMFKNLNGKPNNPLNQIIKNC